MYTIIIRIRNKIHKILKPIKNNIENANNK